MNTKIFFILIAGFALSLFSCFSDLSETSIPPPPERIPSEGLILTVDDIKSYNVTTMEIVFSDLIVEKLTTSNDGGLALYYNGEPLFEDIKVMYPYDSNPWRGFVVLSIGFVGHDELLNKIER